MVPSQSIRDIQYQQSKASFIDADTIFETPVSLAVNGKNWLTFMCTPVLLEEMAIGFLFNEGVIDNLDQVSDVRICEHGDNADMWLNHKSQQPTSLQRTSGCTGGVTGVDLLADPDISFNGNQPKVPPETFMNLVEMLIEVQS